MRQRRRKKRRARGTCSPSHKQDGDPGEKSRGLDASIKYNARSRPRRKSKEGNGKEWGSVLGANRQ